MPLVEITAHGQYCPAGDFHIDPWGPAARAVITHAHAAQFGPGAFLATKAGEALLRARLGAQAQSVTIQSLDYGEAINFGGVRVSLHPAGHILGSAQARLERAGEVWVVSGHYKLAPDPTCAGFEPLRCHVFITEATYGLPIFRWRPASEVRDGILAWWRANRDAGRASLLFAHPVGKAQRLLALLDAPPEPIYCHESVEAVNAIYRRQAIALPSTALANGQGDWRHALILAPPSTALASGWMRIRGTRRRRSLDRGFALSDHADWPDLLRAIAETRAERVWVTAGFRGPVARWIAEHGGSAVAIEGRWEEAER
ncbi:MAG TPA: ligase-associated DNA damage response exonuclease [Bryobacteraceae bacterium]|nr:ligase-associated DNA damage response exonuclease [Bryobacteraceae bacterium]